MSISWPEKKICTSNCYNEKWGCTCGAIEYNTAIDACIKAEAESKKLVSLSRAQLQNYFISQGDSYLLAGEKAEALCDVFCTPPANALVELDIMAMKECGQEAVRNELNQTHCWKLIRIICEAIYVKFGTKPSPVVTVKEWEDVIDAHTDQPPSNVFYKQQKRAIAQAIYDKLNEEGE